MNMSAVFTRRQSEDLNTEKTADMSQLIHENGSCSIKLQPRQSVGHNVLPCRTGRARQLVLIQRTCGSFGRRFSSSR